ncbi:MAG: type I polyketide synthase, partial [Pseudomonadales bacterium]
IEAHGTGTKLGDPVELAALNLAYGKKEGHSCAIGSVKSNVGHLDVAAGITGLIKTVLQLKHRKLAPSLNFQEANPEIDFEAGPFYVNKDLKTWTSEGPRRAGVSSFGIGGTNVHAILEESPPLEETTASSIGLHLLNFSAKTPRSLSDQLLNFQQFLQNYHAPSLQNIAYTLNVGRSNFPYRTSVISSSKQDAHASMAYMAEQVRKGVVPVREKPLLVFMFPGQGSQSKTMFKKLYDTEHKFRELVEECYDIAARHGLEGLKGIHLENHKSIDQTRYAQPLIFIVEVALARWLGILGIQPDVMIGHSLGELTAACVSGAIALEDALKLVIKRGELMQDMPTGDMLSVILPEEQLNDYLKGYEDISIAAINSSGAAVLSGNSESIDQVRKRLEKDQVTNTVLKTSHAFHSHLMEGAIEPFAQAFSEIEIRKMEVPFISNLTGMVITQRELSSATYWSKQIRDTVQFSKGLSHLLQTNHTTFLEVGPGKALG